MLFSSFANNFKRQRRRRKYEIEEKVVEEIRVYD